MSKYPGFMTTQNVCKAEVRECKDILKKYKVMDSDVENITDMIKEAYYQLSESYKMSNAIDAYVKDKLGNEWCKEFFQMYTSRTKEPGENLAAYMKKLSEEENRFKVVK